MTTRRWEDADCLTGFRGEGEDSKRFSGDVGGCLRIASSNRRTKRVLDRIIDPEGGH